MSSENIIIKFRIKKFGNLDCITFVYVLKIKITVCSFVKVTYEMKKMFFKGGNLIQMILRIRGMSLFEDIMFVCRMKKTLLKL